MGHSIDPNTHLQMSREVDRIQQLKYFQDMEKQGLLAHRWKNKNRQRREQVNSKEKSEPVKINKDQSNSQSKKDNEHQENTPEEDDNQESQETEKDRGEFIDYKI